MTLPDPVGFESLSGAELAPPCEAARASPPEADCQSLHEVKPDSCAVDSMRSLPPDRLGELLEAFRRYLLLQAKRSWRDEERRKVGDSDLVQLTIIKGVEHFAEFRGSSPEELAAWLRAILQRLIVSERRRLGAKKAGGGREAAIEQVQVADKTPSARQWVIQEEVREQVRAAVAALPAHYREVVELHQFRKMPFDEVGILLGKSPEAVRKIWARAIVRLGNQLKSQFDSGLRDDSGRPIH